MRSFATSLLTACVGLVLGVALPSSAAATEPVPGDSDADDETVEVVEVREHHHHHARHEHIRWFGLQLGALTTPLSPSGRVHSGNKVTSNPFKACLDPFTERHCSAIRGFDVRVQYYRTHGAWDYPRWVGYFRTGYGAGRADFSPRSDEGYGPGEPKSLSYSSVPLFFGGNVYAFRRSPVRPYGGLGFGFDVLKLQYRNAAGPGPEIIEDVSARIGFELHAGLEARISNVVAITGEVMQLWSARRKIDGVPDFSNTGFTIMAGVAISMPTPGSMRRQEDRHGHHHDHVIRREVRKKKAPTPVVPPAPVVAPAPVHVEVEQHVETAAPVPVVAPPAAPPVVVEVVDPGVAAPAVVTAPPVAPAASASASPPGAATPNADSPP